MKKRVLFFFKKYQSWSTYSLFLFFSLLPFFSYGKAVLNSPYNGVSSVHPLHYFVTWTKENSGMFAYFSLPYDLFIGWLASFLPEFIAINISFALVTFLAFVSFYKLAKHLFHKQNIAIVGSFLYTYSIYGQFMSYAGVSSGSIVFALAPFFVYKFISIEKKNNRIREACVLALVSLLFTAVNLTFLVYLALFCLAIIIFRFRVDALKNAQSSLYVGIITALLFLLLTSSYFLTFGSEYFFQKDFVEENLAAETIDWKSSTGSIHELFREMGAVNYYYEYSKIFSYPNAQIFIKNNFFILLSYIFPILAISALLIKEERFFWRRFRLFLLAALLFSLFMAMGVYKLAPTKYIYRYFSEAIPLFVIFRDAYKAMFIINLIYAILATYIVDRIIEKKILSTKIALSIIMTLIFLQSYQFWGGTFLKHELISVPQYWYSFENEWQKRSQGEKILFMPEMPFTIYTFTSQRVKNTTFYRSLVGYADIANLDVAPIPGSNKVFSIAHAKLGEPAFERTLGLYGVRYVLLQYDADYQVYKVANPEDLREALQKSATFVKSFK